MRRVLGGVLAVVTAVLIAMPQSTALGSSADGKVVDEGWVVRFPDATPGNFGFQGVNFRDALNDEEMVSALRAKPNFPQSSYQVMCRSIVEAPCTTAPLVLFTSVLGRCTTAVELDCIVDFGTVDSTGGKVPAVYEESFPREGLNDFAGNLSMGVPDGGPGGLWKVAESAGLPVRTHFVRVSISGESNSQRKAVFTNFAADVAPVVVRSIPCGESEYEKRVKCQTGYSVDPLLPTGRAGFAGFSDGDFGGDLDCVLTGNLDPALNKAECAERKALDNATRYYLVVRLSRAVSGWMHGRIADPTITLEKIQGSADAVTLSVSAMPVSVPSIMLFKKYTDLPLSLQAKYRPNGAWPNSRGGEWKTAGADLDPNDPLQRNRLSMPSPYGPDQIEELLAWLPVVSDTAIADVSMWSMRTLGANNLGAARDCIGDNSKVAGIVTTNATQYLAGPPDFDIATKTFRYTVAAPHFKSSGETFQGVYNLILRQDVAECLYGFSKAFAAPAPPQEFADEADPDVYVEEEPYTDEEVYAEEYPDFGEEFINTDDGSYEMYEDVEYEEVSLEEYVAEEEDFTLTEDVLESGEVVDEQQAFEESIVASIDASIITELQKAATANTAIELDDGWFKFSATNFTFSKPTVKVNFGATPAKVLACLSGSTVRYVKSIRSQCPTGTALAKTVYCVKGKEADAVVGASPKCPKGTKVGKVLKCAKWDEARLVVGLAPKCERGWSVVRTYFCVKGNVARKVSAVQVKCANGFALARQVTCVKGKVLRTVTAVKPTCPTGYKVRKSGTAH